jgi:hypothetical protein
MSKFRPSGGSPRRNSYTLVPVPELPIHPSATNWANVVLSRHLGTVPYENLTAPLSPAARGLRRPAIGTLESRLGTDLGGTIWLAKEMRAPSVRISASKLAAAIAAAGQ